MNLMRAAIMTMTAVAAAALAQGAWAVEKRVELFNGKDLTNFYTFVKGRGKGVDPKGVFTVRDKMLRISGEEYGCVTTEEEYENYRLIVEFKWGDETHAPRTTRARDSGVLVHSTGEDGGYAGTWMHSIECQVIEGGTGDFIVVGDGSENYSLTTTARVETDQNGREARFFDTGGTSVTLTTGRMNWWGRDPGWVDALGFRGMRDVEKPAGEWNRLEVIAEGETINVLLNGTKVNEAKKCVPTRGRIQLQSEGAELFVRRVELIPLGEKVQGDGR